METEWIQGKCIGKGSFGTVNLAYSKSDGREIAIKSAPSSSQPSVDSLANEINILSSLPQHPNIITYLGNSQTHHHLNLHLAYVPNGTLAEAAGSLSDPAVRSYTRSILRALFHLHNSGVVHSDVKGRNVLIGSQPESAKLVDFGSARRIGEGLQQGGAIVGTPLWMAPEVVRGEGATPASDVWSVGCTVIEMVSGAQPWRCGNNSGEDYGVMLKIAFGDDIPEFPSMSKVGMDFLEKCLRRDPGKRWTAEQLLRHPFLAETTDEEERSPRSTLDWAYASSESDEEESDHDDIVEYASDLGMERIKELAENCGSVDWDRMSDEEWEVVRCCEGEAIASGSDECDDEVRCEQVATGVRRGRRLDWDQLLLMRMTVFNANPMFFTLVLRVMELYRYDKLIKFIF